jgi:mannosyltransferase
LSEAEYDATSVPLRMRGLFDIILPCLTCNLSAVLSAASNSTPLREPDRAETNVRQPFTVQSVRDRRRPQGLRALLLNARHDFWLVLALTTAGAILRVFHLGTQSLWLDELFSVAVARQDWPRTISDTINGDTNPPLFNLLLHIALQFGSDETAARVLSCIFSIATIPMFYALARALFDRRVALLAALLLVLSPFHWLFAQEARMYAQLAFLSVASSLLFLKAWRGDGLPAWPLFVVTTSLAFYSHSLAFLNLLALDVFALTQWQTLRAHWRSLLLAHVSVLLVFVPWLPSMMQQATRVQSGFWTGSPPLLGLFVTPYLFVFSNVVPLSVVPVALFAGLSLVAFALTACVHEMRARGVWRDALAFALAGFAVPLLVLCGLSWVRPIFVERTLIGASFGLYMVMAWAVVHARPSALLRTAMALVVVIAFISIPNYYFNPETQRPPMREASHRLSELMAAGDTVAHTSDSSALAFAYYEPTLPNHFLTGDPDYQSETTRAQTGRVMGLVPEEVGVVVTQHGRVWLVVALDHNEAYQRARAAEFDARWTRQASEVVGGISLTLYRLEPGH